MYRGIVTMKLASGEGLDMGQALRAPFIGTLGWPLNGGPNATVERIRSEILLV
jgi:hypothetical protein